ncbi:hypothetical protein ACUOA5_48485, partial [Escherichia coli]
NQNILKTHTPHHNGYDVILDRNATQYIDGKFQYGDFRKDLEGEWISILNGIYPLPIQNGND